MGLFSLLPTALPSQAILSELPSFPRAILGRLNLSLPGDWVGSDL